MVGEWSPNLIAHVLGVRGSGPQTNFTVSKEPKSMSGAHTQRPVMLLWLGLLLHSLLITEELGHSIELTSPTSN